MPPVQKARNWRLHVLGTRKKTYILDNLYFASLARDIENHMESKQYFRDFVREEQNPQPEHLPSAKDLLHYCEVIASNLGQGRGYQFILNIQNVLKRHDPCSKCYLRMQTQEEQDEMLAMQEWRSQRFWDKPRPCDVCGEEGRMYGSPWGVPAVLTLCKRHCNLLFLDSTLFSAIVATSTAILAILVMGNICRLSAAIGIAIVFLIIRAVPWWKIL